MTIQPWHWFVLGVVLIIAEMFTMTFAALWFGVAAVLVATLAWLFPEALQTWESQTLLWLVISVFTAIAWFKLIQPVWSKNRTKARLGGGDVIIGEVGMIVKQPLSDRAGTIRFSVPIVGATEWQCRAEEGSVKVGDRVVVSNILGNELVVRPLDTDVPSDTTVEVDNT